MTSPYHKALQGVGWVSFVPLATTANPQPDPVHVAEIESLDYNVSEDTADLTDANGDTVDTFVTKRVIEGSITMKAFSGSLLAIATRGVTITANRPMGYSHSATIPTTPFEVTVALTAPTRTFTTDLGVIDLTAGKMMSCAATATGTGVYMLDTGTGKYTFNTADSGHAVLIMYRATPSATDGITADIAAASANAGTYYGLHCYQSAGAKPWGVYIPSAQLSGLSAKFSKTSWSESTIKWKATKDATTGRFGYVYSAE